MIELKNIRPSLFRSSYRQMQVTQFQKFLYTINLRQRISKWFAFDACVILCICILPKTLTAASEKHSFTNSRQAIRDGQVLNFSDSASKSERTVQADWIIEAIKNSRSVSIYNAIIVGSLNLNNLTSRGRLMLHSCVFEENVDFSLATFKAQLVLVGSTFENGAVFTSVSCESDLDLREAVFKSKTVDFQKMRVQGQLSLDKASFEENAFADFTQAILEDVASGSVDYKEGATFLLAVVHGYASFSGSNFRKDSNFESAQFGGYVYFDYDNNADTLKLTIFHERANFYNAVFKSGVGFNGCSFMKDANFSSFHCHSGASFDGLPELKVPATTFKADVDFSNAQFTWANFRGTVFEHKVSYNSATFDGNLYFVDYTRSNLAAIFDGDVDCRGMHVIGECGFGGTFFKGGADFHNAQFDKNAYFQGSKEPAIASAIFDGNTIFSGTHFGGEADFQGVKFNRDFDFSRAAFIGTVGLGGSAETSSQVEFVGTGRFDNCHFYDDVNFAGVIFKGNVTFNSTRFDSSTFFEGVAENHVPSNIFEGDVDFSYTHFSWVSFRGTTFKKSVTFQTMVVDKQIFFNGDPATKATPVEFNASAIFRDVEVKGLADFRGVRFKQGADFNSAKFDDNASFEGSPETGRPTTVFEQTANFVDARFKWVSFRGVTFKGDATFDTMRVTSHILFGPDATLALKSAVFEGNMDFSNTRVGGTGDFEGVQFEKDATFDGSQFDGGISFNAGEGGKDRAAFFRGVADFSAIRVGNIADFRAVIFNNNVSFYAGKVDSQADFERAQFRQRASFESCRFAGVTSFGNALLHDLILRDSSFRSLKFSPNGRVGTEEQIQGSLDLRGCVYDQIEGDWRSFSQRMQFFARQPFVQLEKAYRQAGDDDSAEAVYLEWKTRQRHDFFRQFDFLGWVLSGLHGLIANYGVQPYRLLGFSFVLLLAGTFLFSKPGWVWFRDERFPDRPTALRQLTPMEALLFSLRLFLPGVPVGTQWILSQDPVKTRLRFHFIGCALRRLPRYRFVRWTRRPFMVRPTSVAAVLTLAGWILVPLGIAALTGLLRITTP